MDPVCSGCVARVNLMFTCKYLHDCISNKKFGEEYTVYLSVARKKSGREGSTKALKSWKGSSMKTL